MTSPKGPRKIKQINYLVIDEKPQPIPRPLLSISSVLQSLFLVAIPRLSKCMFGKIGLKKMSVPYGNWTLKVFILLNNLMHTAHQFFNKWRCY